MKLSVIIANLSLLPALVLGVQVMTTYDETYDDASRSLNATACSNGPNGLVTAGYPTFGSLPNFPYIGGSFAVANWNSANCGTCWKLTYTNPIGVSKSINVIAVDHADNGFNIALKAMNDLTNNHATCVGIVKVVATQIAKSNCGFKN